MNQTSGNQTDLYFDLSDLCHSLHGFSKNGTSPDWEFPEEHPSSLLDEIIKQGFHYNRSSVNLTLEFLLKEFEHFTEWYLITAVAAIGIASNLAVMFLLGRDKVLRPMAYILHMLLLGFEVLYLICVIVFIQLRHFSSRGNAFEEMWRISVMSVVLSLSQGLSTWLLFVLVNDSYRAIKMQQKPGLARKLREVIRNVVLVFLGCLVYHIPYVPEIRILLHHLDPAGFDPCNVPIKDHWEFDMTSGGHDLYYILYYSLAYTLVLMVIPFFKIAYQDKCTIDHLHAVKDYTGYKHPNYLHTCYIAKVVSVFCNVHLFCISPKLTLLLFQMVNYAVNFIGDAQIYFEFFNVLANLLIVFKASAYMFLFVIFHPKLKVIICMACCKKCFIMWHKHKHDKHEKQMIPVLTITDTDAKDENGEV